MKMMLCPVCGRLRRLLSYDPTDFEPDIFVEEMRGLGRGRGFAVEKAYSIFECGEPEAGVALERIGKRILELLRVLLDNDVITESDLVNQVGLLKSDQAVLLALDVLRFLDQMREYLYCADAAIQLSALELERKASILKREAF